MLFHLAACVSVAEPPPDVSTSPFTATQTIKSSSTPFLPTTLTPQPTNIPTNTQTLAETPPPLEGFIPRLAKDVKPVTYLDTCEYRAARWDSHNAQPGSIVVPIMYHGIRKEGGSVNDNITVKEKYFKETIQHAVELGFQTITIEQLAAFLQRNACILHFFVINH